MAISCKSLIPVLRELSNGGVGCFLAFRSENICTLSGRETALGGWYLYIPFLTAVRQHWVGERVSCILGHEYAWVPITPEKCPSKWLFFIPLQGTKRGALFSLFQVSYVIYWSIDVLKRCFTVVTSAKYPKWSGLVRYGVWSSRSINIWGGWDIFCFSGVQIVCYLELLKSFWRLQNMTVGHCLRVLELGWE